MASFYICGSSSTNWLKWGHSLNYRDFASSPLNEVFVTTSLEPHQVKAAKNVHHTFQITDTFLQSSSNAKDKFHVKCSDQLRKQNVFSFVFFFFFKEINESLKIPKGGLKKKKKKKCALAGLVDRQQQASKVKYPVCQINAESQICLRYTPKEYSI